MLSGIKPQPSGNFGIEETPSFDITATRSKQYMISPFSDVTEKLEDSPDM